MGKDTDRDIAELILSNVNAIAGQITNIEFSLFRAQIKEQPIATITAVLGDTVTISLSAINTVSYQWYSKKVTDASWSKVTGGTTDTLSFTATETGNTSYRCEITGKDGYSTISNSCLVMIRSE